MSYYFNGPSETNKDFLAEAAKQLYIGNWQQTQVYIDKLNFWHKFTEAAQIKEKLLVKIKEQAYKNYIMCNNVNFEIINLTKMAEQF